MPLRQARGLRRIAGAARGIGRRQVGRGDLVALAGPRRFRREGGVWKIASLAFDFKYYSPYEDGWAKTPMWQIPG